MDYSIEMGSVVTELVWHVWEHTIPAALDLLPGRMDTLPARAMMLATGFQESEFNARVQGGRGTTPGKGPARSFWQFERAGGVAEILNSKNTSPIIRPICRMFLYEPTPAVIHDAMAHHDVLAACMARLLLYRDPRSMPVKTDPDLGWSIYVRNWRPGKPHPEKWPRNFRLAWEIAEGVVHAEAQ